MHRVTSRINEEGRDNIMERGFGGIGVLEHPDVQKKISELSKIVHVDHDSLQDFLKLEAQKKGELFSIEKCKAEVLKDHACIDFEEKEAALNDAKQKLENFEAEINDCREVLALLRPQST
eukprot:TRINITY_DN4674_c0_g1_i1.p2 TRINITY_DN4674_c0_g1~~TRINITY_DN4674_c0_g1_i1.p2  ORF type:complete len:120 (-),score=34.63 TRINITY_DN4674_c0_g1_i1:67-426(-)